MSAARLDAKLIRERRLQQHLTRPQLARKLGVSTTVVDGLEAGSNHGEQTLALLDRLADALGIDLAALIPAPTVPLPPSPDTVRIEAGLAALGQAVSAAGLATAFDWSLPRTNAALQSLGLRLQPTGQRLHRVGGKYKLIAAEHHLSAIELQRLEHRRVATNRMTKSEARTLAAVIRGEVTARWLADSTPERHTTSHRLLRLGYAEQHDGGLRATHDVLRGLGMHR